MHESAPASPLNVLHMARVGQCLPEDHDVLVHRSLGARHAVSAAPVGPRPLEDLEMLVVGSNRARDFATGLPVGPRPLQDREVPACCRKTAERLRKSFRR